jgi:diguanylate cyclase (GGDEF)-like protein
MDIMMPGINGYQLCEQLKEDRQTQDIPVLFISALNGTGDKVKGFSAGAVDYITKPFKQEEVLSRIKIHLELRNMQLALQNQNQQLAREIEERQRVEAQLADANRKLEKLATIDKLTQLANRSLFDETLANEWSRMQREKNSLGLILCDIDYFKKYNDAYGHLAGDKCLQKVAAALGKQVRRTTDLVARYGGEEFAVIMPNTSLEGAKEIAEHIQGEIRAMKLPHTDSEISDILSLSLGVAATIPVADSHPESLVASADQALYRAKKGGRDRISAINSPLHH